MQIRQKSLLLPRNLGLVTFGESIIAFSTKANLLCFLYLITRRCFFSTFDETKLFPDIFSEKYNLDESGYPLPAFPSKTFLTLGDILVTP